MQTSRVYDPNERVSLALPARMVNLVLEVFRKVPNLGLPYDVIQELLVEIQTQLQQSERSLGQTAEPPPPVVQQTRRIKANSVEDHAVS